MSILTVWRRAAGRAALTATAEYWSLVFPLSMYAAATHQIAERVGWPALVGLSRGFLAIAAAAWLFGVVALGGRRGAGGDAGRSCARPRAFHLKTR